MRAGRQNGSFAHLIITARKARNWSQNTLATHSGTSRATIIRYESGEAVHPEPGQIRAVCAALDIDPKRALLALGYLTADDLVPAA